MFKKKITSILLSILMLISAFVFPQATKASGLNGWKQNGTVWNYYIDGNLITGWQLYGGKWYYLNSDGSMAIGWKSVAGNWYYFKPNGEMKIGWYQEWSTWYFLKSSGAMAANTWAGNYYLSASGAMLVNAYTPDGYYVRTDGSWDGKGKVSSGQLKVHYIDVGQGDSILIQTPNGKNMLIDAGTNESTSKVTSYLSRLGITQLDIIAGTHPHEDHIGEMDAVINMFKVGKVYMPKVISTTQTYEDVITAIKNKGLSITTPIPGTTVDLDPAVKLEILAPNDGNYDDLNNYSIVFKLTYGSRSFLFTGDAQALSESEMLSKGFNLSADVLKVGHHGSNTSTSDAFLNAVNPKYAVISVGKNNVYGHPTQSTLQKLSAKGISTYRTDLNGSIVATCDGQNISFSCESGSATNPLPQNNKVTAAVDNSTPAQYSTVHITVTGPVGGNVNLVCHYKSTNTPYSGTIGADGKTIISVQIARASIGYNVKVDVSVTSNGQVQNTQTSFTPQ